MLYDGGSVCTHVSAQSSCGTKYCQAIINIALVSSAKPAQLLHPDPHSPLSFLVVVTRLPVYLFLEKSKRCALEGTSLRYRLNWGAGGKRIEQAPEYSVFVGDLSPEVSDAELKATFLEKYPSVLGAKVVTNPMTGSSKSFGFIRFGDEQERDEALTAMNGAECCGRPIRVAPATKRTGVQGARRCYGKESNYY